MASPNAPFLYVSIIILSASPVLAQQAPEAIELDAITIEGEPQEETGGINGVVENQGHVTKAARTATKTSTPLLEVPQSISTVTGEQLDERKPQNLQEALNYAPGARVGGFGFDPRYDAFTIRGIDMTYTGVFRDGMRQLNSPNGLFRLEPYGLESVTILRGPAAAIYGASSTGGIVDLITKRPTDHAFGEIELQTGSFDRIQGAFDLSGPANEEGTVLYRLTGLARDAGTEIDAVKDDRFYIAPAVTFMPSEDTKITLLAEYMDSTTGGTVAYINNYDYTNPLAPLSLGATKQFGGDGRFNDYDQEQGRIGWEFEHRFNDTFTLNQNFRYSALSTNQEYIFGGYPGLVREDTGGMVADTYLTSRFVTGAAKHTLLTGIDISYLDYTGWSGYGYTTAFPPVWDQVDDYAQTQSMVGIYAQDQVELGNWRFLLGGRYDWLNSDYEMDSSAAPTVVSESQDEGEFTWRTALGYVTEWNIAPYIAYGTSFTPNPGTVLDGSVAVPTTGEQIELGVKYDLPGANASLRAAVFEIKQNNALVFEVVNGVNEQTQLDLTSRGFEIEAVASLADGFDIQASYSYNDVEIDRLTPETEGNTLSGIPYHTFSVWADYTFQSGWAEGLGIGGGVRYVGSSFGDNLNRPVLDNKERVFVDASVRYDLGNLDPSLDGARLQVSATNLLDEVNQVCSSNYCYWDEGRKVIASLRYRW